MYTYKEIGTIAKPIRGMTIQDSPRNIIKIAEEKAIIIVAMEKKRVKRPIIILVGKDFWKYSASKCNVRIPKNINTEVEEENSDRESAIIKILNNFLFKKIGKPVS